MPIGHVVDLVWRWKDLLVYFGAALIALSIAIMYGLIAHTAFMSGLMSVEAWFVLSALLAPTGYVIQDIVADAMTVEAVPVVDARGNAYPEADIKAMHTTMQTLGRVAIIGGLVLVAALNIFMFSNVEQISEAAKVSVYAEIYLLALFIPIVSVVGVTVGSLLRRRRAQRMRQAGLDEAHIQRMLFAPAQPTEPNWWILGGSLLFVAFTVVMGLSNINYAQEVIFLGSMGIVAFLMRQLVWKLEGNARCALLGTAIIIFIFRAVPLPGPGATWFEIDVLKFDQRFLSVLLLIGSGLTLAGMLVLRPLMAKRSTRACGGAAHARGALLSLPNIRALLRHPGVDGKPDRRGR